MEKRNKPKSVFKKSSNLYLRNSRNKLTLEKFLTNLQDQDYNIVNHSKQITQCVFLGALCLRPVPDIFQVTLQPISFNNQSNSSVLCGNIQTNNINLSKNDGTVNITNTVNPIQTKKHSRKNSRKTSSTNTNSFIGTVIDERPCNRILELFNKKSMSDELVSKGKLPKVTLKLSGKSDNDNNLKYKIKLGGPISKSNKRIKQDESSKKGQTSPKHKSVTGKSIHKTSPKTKKGQQKVGLHKKNILFDESNEIQSSSSSSVQKSIPPLKIKIKNSQYKTEKNEKFFFEKNFHIVSEKKEKNFKVMETKSFGKFQAKQIPSLMPVQQVPDRNGLNKELKKRFASSLSNPFIIDLEAFSPREYLVNNSNKKSVIESEYEVEEMIELDVDEDDIEDYLEIDQNVVADLEALIPEEEILSISNSLLKGMQKNSERDEDSPCSSANKRVDNSVMLTKPLKTPSCDSRNCEKSIEINTGKSQEFIKIYDIRHVENKNLEIGQDDDVIEVKILNRGDEFNNNLDISALTNRGQVNKLKEPQVVDSSLQENHNSKTEVRTAKRKSDEINLRNQPCLKKNKVIEENVNAVLEKHSLESYEREDKFSKDPISKLQREGPKTVRKITDFLSPTLPPIKKDHKIMEQAGKHRTKMIQNEKDSTEVLLTVNSEDSTEKRILRSNTTPTAKLTCTDSMKSKETAIKTVYNKQVPETDQVPKIPNEVSHTKTSFNKDITGTSLVMQNQIRTEQEEKQNEIIQSKSPKKEINSERLSATGVEIVISGDSQSNITENIHGFSCDNNEKEKSDVTTPTSQILKEEVIDVPNNLDKKLPEVDSVPELKNTVEEVIEVPHNLDKKLPEVDSVPELNNTVDDANSQVVEILQSNEIKPESNDVGKQSTVELRDELSASTLQISDACSQKNNIVLENCKNSQVVPSLLEAEKIVSNSKSVCNYSDIDMKDVPTNILQNEISEAKDIVKGLNGSQLKSTSSIQTQTDIHLDIIQPLRKNVLKRRIQNRKKIIISKRIPKLTQIKPTLTRKQRFSKFLVGYQKKRVKGGLKNKYHYIYKTNTEFRNEKLRKNQKRTVVHNEEISTLRRTNVNKTRRRRTENELLLASQNTDENSNGSEVIKNSALFLETKTRASFKEKQNICSEHVDENLNENVELKNSTPLNRKTALNPRKDGIEENLLPKNELSEKPEFKPENLSCFSTETNISDQVNSIVSSHQEDSNEKKESKSVVNTADIMNSKPKTVKSAKQKFFVRNDKELRSREINNIQLNCNNADTFKLNDLSPSAMATQPVPQKIGQCSKIKGKSKELKTVLPKSSAQSKQKNLRMTSKKHKGKHVITNKCNSILNFFSGKTDDLKTKQSCFKNDVHSENISKATPISIDNKNMLSLSKVGDNGDVPLKSPEIEIVKEEEKMDKNEAQAATPAKEMEKRKSQNNTKRAKRSVVKSSSLESSCTQLQSVDISKETVTSICENDESLSRITCDDSQKSIPVEINIEGKLHESDYIQKEKKCLVPTTKNISKKRIIKGKSPLESGKKSLIHKHQDSKEKEEIVEKFAKDPTITCDSSQETVPVEGKLHESDSIEKENKCLVSKIKKTSKKRSSKGKSPVEPEKKSLIPKHQDNKEKEEMVQEFSKDPTITCDSSQETIPVEVNSEGKLHESDSIQKENKCLVSTIKNTSKKRSSKGKSPVESEKKSWIPKHQDSKEKEEMVQEFSKDPTITSKETILVEVNSEGKLQKSNSIKKECFASATEDSTTKKTSKKSTSEGKPSGEEAEEPLTDTLVPKKQDSTDKEEELVKDEFVMYRTEPYKRINKCNVCLIVLPNYYQLKKHKMVHDVKNPYQCQECGESYEDVEKLAAHLRIHKGKMPYPCKKCDSCFWTSDQLERHQLVHILKKVPPANPKKAPKKLFKCDECGKPFKKMCELERHTRVHTGEKPSVCNICNKRFQQAYNLHKHLLIHTQEKNFECVICQKKFGRNDVLNRHVLTHSIDKPFHCTICSKTFIRNTQLSLHMKKKHGAEENSGSSVDDPVAGKSTE